MEQNQEFYHFGNIREKEADELKFYDFGWNACCRGEAFNPEATIDWRDGWQDCNSAPEKDRVII